VRPRGAAQGSLAALRASSPFVSDAEHELLRENTEQVQEIARLRALLARVARAAIDAQDRADGRHEPWLDELLPDLRP
jgi:hypothetical protein